MKLFIMQFKSFMIAIDGRTTETCTSISSKISLR
jgi:hypothetical protein